MYKIGTDPEMFLKVGSEFVSAHGLFPGTKEEPFKLDKGAVQVDGLALEFNIDPASSEDEFAGNIKTVMAQVEGMIREVNPDMKPIFTPFARFNPEYFAHKVPDEAKILGCNPDMTVTGIVKEAPAIFNRPFRTAAGHIHIGWNDEAVDVDDLAHVQDCKFVATHFHRAWNGIGPKPGSVLTTEERQRLDYYGGGGAYRIKPYGIELRHPSNLWLQSEEKRREMYRFVTSEMARLEQVS